MKKWIVIGVVALAVILIYNLTIGTYNNLVTRDEDVKKQWSQVENVYQRRMDFIPNLVETVKGVAEFEKSTLEGVIQARASATQMKVDASNLNPEAIAKFQQAQGQLGAALGRLMVVSEQYPQLRSNESFNNLMAQLEGTENRITVERMKFNESAQSYNTYLRAFPRNMIGGMFGFVAKGYFEASAGAEKAPQVKF